MAKTRSEASTTGGGRVPFRVDLQQSNRCTRVLAAGDLDSVALDHLDEALALAIAARRRPRVEVDLHAVTFIDGAAIDVLLGAARQARATGGEFWVAGPPLPLRRLLAIPEVCRLLDVRSRQRVIDADS